MKQARPVLVDVQPAAAPPRPSVARRSPGGGGGFMQGDLAALELADVVQLLSTTRKSATLTLRRQGLAGRIVLQAGQVVDAQLGARRGEDALRELLAWTQGTFLAHATVGPVQRTVTRPTERVLVELMQQLGPAACAAAGR